MSHSPIVNRGVQQALENWMYEMGAAKGASKHTLVAYQNDLADFLAFMTEHAGEMPDIETLAGINARDIRGFMARLQNAGSGVATRNRKLSALKSFYRYLKRECGIENDAVLMARGPKKPVRLPRPLSPDMAQAAIDNTDQVSPHKWVQARDRALMTLLYATGLRISEALSINQGDLPLGSVLRIRGKGNKVRMVPVLAEAAQAMNEYERQLPYVLEANDPIFRGVRGGVMSARAAASLMQNLRNQLGLPASATPHAMRHSFASHLLAAGGDIRAIQELLGHASLNATQIYTQLDEAKILDVYRDAHPKGRSAG